MTEQEFAKLLLEKLEENQKTDRKNVGYVNVFKIKNLSVVEKYHWVRKFSEAGILEKNSNSVTARLNPENPVHAALRLRKIAEGETDNAKRT